MKKVFMFLASTALLLSCGGPTTPCDCANSLNEMNSAYEDAKDDKAQQEKLNKKFEKLNKECEALSEEMGQEAYQKAFKDCLEK